jgi:hypothetical protein
MVMVVSGKMKKKMQIFTFEEFGIFMPKKHDLRFEQRENSVRHVALPL